MRLAQYQIRFFLFFRNIIKSKDERIFISGDTINHIVLEHPEFEEDKIPRIIQDLLNNAVLIQRNKRDDTVRIIAENFVKSLHPRDKLKKGELLWPKSKE